MRIDIDNTTRFFTVVGAPYLPEHHLDASDDAWPRAALHAAHPATTPPPGNPIGSWLYDDP
jgi:hypothetical protein